MSTTKFIYNQIKEKYISIKMFNHKFPNLIDNIFIEYWIKISVVKKFRFHACNTVLLMESNRGHLYILKIFNKIQRYGQFEIEYKISNILSKNWIIIPKIIKNLSNDFNSFYDTKKIVLYDFIVARDLSWSIDDIDLVIRKFANFHITLNSNIYITNLFYQKKLFNKELSKTKNSIFYDIFCFFKNTKYSILTNILKNCLNFNLYCDIENIIYWWLSKDHIAIKNHNLILYDMESIWLWDLYLDVMYVIYYLWYRNNDENLEIYKMIHMLNVYNKFNKLYITKKNFNLYVLYFLFLDFKVMLKQKNEFTDFHLNRHYYNILNFYKLYFW